MATLCISQSLLLTERTFLREGLHDWLESGAVISTPTTGNSEPESLWVGWGSVTRSSLNAAELPDGYFYAPDFFLDGAQPVWSFARYSRVSLRGLQDALTDALRGAQTNLSSHGLGWPALEWKEAEAAQFTGAFAELADRFKTGRLAKAVPVVFDRAPWPAYRDHCALRAHWIQRALEYAGRAPVYVYGAWTDGEGILGATPELLLRKEKDSLWSTMAMAGTRRDSDREKYPALLEDPKERREHQIVIEGIEQALGSFGHVQVSATEEVFLPGLSHLKTPILLDTGESDAELPQLIQALHPTPALGAFPREAGPEILRLLDQRSPLPRGRFGAPFGFSSPFLSPTPFDLAVVAIRNLQWNADEILAGAGCGVIAESQPEREWLELRAKLASVRGIFGA